MTRPTLVLLALALASAWIAAGTFVYLTHRSPETRAPLYQDPDDGWECFV